MSTSRIHELQKELAELEAKEKSGRLAKNKKAVDSIIAGMSLEEMREVREVLNARIADKYASDAIDDE